MKLLPLQRFLPRPPGEKGPPRGGRGGRGGGRGGGGRGGEDLDLCFMILQLIEYNKTFSLLDSLL